MFRIFINIKSIFALWCCCFFSGCIRVTWWLKSQKRMNKPLPLTKIAPIKILQSISKYKYWEKSIRCRWVEAWLSLKLEIKLLCPASFQKLVKNTFLILANKFDLICSVLFKFSVFGCFVFIWSLMLLPLFFLKHRLIISTISLLCRCELSEDASVFCLALIC